MLSVLFLGNYRINN